MTSGFDHGFGNLATYNGFEAGEKLPENYASHSGPAQKVEEPQDGAEPKKQDFQFTFEEEKKNEPVKKEPSN